MSYGERICWRVYSSRLCYHSAASVEIIHSLQTDGAENRAVCFVTFNAKQEMNVNMSLMLVFSLLDCFCFDHEDSHED